MTNHKRPLYVTGDEGAEVYIHVQSLVDTPPNLREAWVQGRKLDVLEFQGGAGQVKAVLEDIGVRADPVPTSPRSREKEDPESFYFVTQERKPDQPPGAWKVGLSVVAGERDLHRARVDVKGLQAGRPVVVLDYHQGWVEANADVAGKLLAGRDYLVRTHDPTDAGGVWPKVRKRARAGIWFSPLQDLANGALRITGNWETVRDRVKAYLRCDGTLWEGRAGWKHTIVIQIAADGVLVLGPGRRETLSVFPGDQPGSFNLRVTGSVVGGGVMMVTSLAAAVAGADWPGLGPKRRHERVVAAGDEGLARCRELQDAGYEDAETARNQKHPFRLETPETAMKRELPQKYGGPPTPTIEMAKELVEAKDGEFRRKTAYSVGELYTCDPTYAQELMLLRERVETHVVVPGASILSLGVLGGPGSGKSFLVEQIQKSLGSDLKTMQYNLSQFTGQEQLLDAFAAIQTSVLQGKVPFVQWDEFDCFYDGDAGGWVRRFLMPMQDAAYWDGGEQRKLGKCVFAFIAGTWATEGAFQKWSASAAARKLKAPDFHSRLDRVIEVPGVDLPRARGRAAGALPVSAPAYLNRALVIRLAFAKIQKLREVDDDALEFLLTAKLRHGIRSLRAIIEASDLRKTEQFSTHHLPPPEVLKLHVVGSVAPGPCGGRCARVHVLEGSKR